MGFETTTCISLAHRNILEHYAKRCDLPLSKLIVSMINYAALHEKKKNRPFRHIQYRERHTTTWKRVHLCLSYHEYEFLLDMKKLWKMSVALLVAYCVENVLIEFVEALLKEEHNYSYRFMHYTFDFNKVCDMPAYRCIWGVPPELLQKT